MWLYEEELPAVLTPEDEAYLRGLPAFLAVRVDDLGLMLSHYTYPDLLGDSTTFDPSQSEQLTRHFRFMGERGCSIGCSGHEGFNGMVLSTPTERREVGFGICALPSDEPVWIQSPWVANGTYANGALVLDTTRREIESLPLKSPPHRAPDRAEG